MLVKNLLIRPAQEGYATISWTSDTPETLSWVFINGHFTAGPFMAETTNRTITLPVPTDKTYIVEIHDFPDVEQVPESIEQKPLIKPQLSWNCVEGAVSYKVYHTIFGEGEIESLLLQSFPMGVDRMEIDCPMNLDGRGGRWHSFRVESVDQFGNESVNEIVPHFAADLPPQPQLAISRDTVTGRLTFRILS